MSVEAVKSTPQFVAIDKRLPTPLAAMKVRWQERDGSGIWSRHAHWMVGLAPLLILIWVVWRYSVDVPFYDQWYFIPLLDKMYQGQLTFSDVWAQFNEHRIVFPKLLMLGLARLTHWNISCENAASVVLAVGIFLVLAAQIRATARVLGLRQLRWAIPACSLVVFSISQFENWMWGWQVGLLLGLLAAVASILLLANQPFRWSKLIGSGLLAFVATFSFGNGVLAWPVGLAALWFSHRELPARRVALGIWCTTATISFSLYFRDYHSPPDSSLMSIFHRPLSCLTYLLRFIGSTCAQYGDRGVLRDKACALAFGAAALAILGWSGWQSTRVAGEKRTALVSYFALAAYSLGTALMTTIARVGIGTAQSMASRYCSLTGPLWFSIIILLMVLALSSSAVPNSGRGASGEQKRIDEVKIARWLLIGVVSVLAFGSMCAIRSAEELSGKLATGRQFVLDLKRGATLDGPHGELVFPSPGLIATKYPLLLRDRILFVIFPSPEEVASKYPILLQNHLSTLRE